MFDRCGTPAYVAPEVLGDSGYDGVTSDVWSAGVVLYAMLYGNVPFRADNMTELQRKIRTAEYDLASGVSSKAKDLLRKILTIDLNKRLTSSEVLEHPWMQDAADKVQLFTQAETDYMLSQL